MAGSSQTRASYVLKPVAPRRTPRGRTEGGDFCTSDTLWPVDGLGSTARVGGSLSGCTP